MAMLDHRYLRENPEESTRRLQFRNPELDLKTFFELDEKRRLMLQEEEKLKQERNQVSQEIAKAKREGGSAEEKIARMQKVASRIKELEEERKKIEKDWQKFLESLPNLPAPEVPQGKDEEENKEVKRWGDPAQLSFEPLPHWEIGEKLDILDIKRGTKVSGSRFYFMKNEGALLERALINFFLDYHTRKNGYREIVPPFLVSPDSAFGTGQLPKMEEDMFRCEHHGYYLIPTAEVPLTNLHREEILPEENLPVKVCGYSPCFRAEAGAHGRDTRGIIRQHQFNKVELVNFTTPDKSYEQLEILVREAETMLELLELPYRRVVLCTGDLGFASAFTYDLEVWLPSSDRYREISSCSNFTDFQARRMGARFRPKDGGRAEFLHTLNGSGLAVGRTVAAIMENFQDEKGRIHIPRVLHNYTGGLEVIE